MVGGRHQKFLDVIVLYRLHTLDSFAAAVLAAEIVHAHTLDITEFCHCDHGIGHRNQILHGNIIGIKAVNQDSEIMLITTEGIIIRMKVEDISLLGRVTSGVKLINMDDDITVASIAKVREDKSLTTQEETEDTEEAESENEK